MFFQIVTDFKVIYKSHRGRLHLRKRSPGTNLLDRKYHFYKNRRKNNEENEVTKVGAYWALFTLVIILKGIDLY